MTFRTKLFCVMKLTTMIMLAGCLQVSAHVHSQKLSYKARNAPLEEVLTHIKQQTGYLFIYNDRDIAKARPVTVSLKDVTVETALKEVFKEQPLTYEVRGNNVVIIAKQASAVAVSPAAPLRGDSALMSTDIRGRVVNEKGEPVEGVNVLIKGTKTRTQTNANGEFSLLGVAGNATLLFTHVSMESFEYKVQNGNTNDVLIKLKAKITALGEIAVTVNTGYQSIPKERSVGSYAQLDSVAYHRRTGMDIISRLDGTVPGVLFDKKIPQGAGPFLQIRGISTLGRNGISFDPLIVVDNFPYSGDINSINPNDVENITVLKDAASASIWGTRAGNGVIVITTKKGKYNQPIHLSIASNITIQQKPDLYYYPQMSSSDFIDVEQFLFSKQFRFSDTASAARPVFSPVYEILFKLRNGNITQAQADAQINALRRQDLRNDLNKYVYRAAIMQQHYLNLSGGNSIFNYHVSAGYNHSMPNIKNSRHDEQYTIASNNYFRPFRNLELQVGINYTQGTNKSVGLVMPNNIYPYAQLADDQGNSLAIPYLYRMLYLDTAGAGKLLDWQYRPLDEIKQANQTSTNKLFRLNFGASFKFTTWLTAEIRYQYVNQVNANRNYYNLQSYFARDLINKFTNLNQSSPALRYPIPLNGILDVSNSDFYSHNARGQLNINKNWSNKHSVSGLIATELSESRGPNSNNNRFYGYDDVIGTYQSNIDYVSFYPVNNQLIGSAARIPTAIGINQGAIIHLVSVLANGAYTYNGKYTLYASARRDGANVFGVNTNNKWKPLWSTGASWNLSKESFYKIKWMPELRIRASYGYMGNVNNFSSGKPTIIYRGPAYYTNLQSAQTGDAPTPDLRWEQVTTLNFGIDFSLFKNRIYGSVEFFNKKSTDVIYPVSLDATSGVESFIINAANLKGNGYEVNLHSKNTIGVLKWETSFSLSHAKTTVTGLGTNPRGNFNFFSVNQFTGYGLNPSVGKLAYGLASYRWAGLDPVTGDPQGYLNGHVSKNYNSIFNDSVQHQVFHGSAIPLYSGFINNSFTRKGITLSANITYRFSYYFRKPSLSYGALFSSWQGHADYVNRWQKPGDEAFTSVPSMIYPANSNRDRFYQFSEVNVLRGDNIRLQDIRLQYNIDKQIWKKLPLQSAQVFLYANNLNIILWRKNKSQLDPDFTGGSFNPAAGPTPKLWTMGINFNF